MMPNRTGFDHLLLSRREMLSRSGMGFAALGLAGLMASDQRLTAAETAINPLAPRGPICHIPDRISRKCSRPTTLGASSSARGQPVPVGRKAGNKPA